ncbi:hypothetical protein [Carnobacterium maltaromaticum]|uniref:hypothetical protein n=1 Tax=Carnobacterium maltaromaticum TaxID=2751 RepID=UPI0012F95199|nr:hypothetical protein [Carnobacterium maltaromaticum]
MKFFKIKFKKELVMVSISQLMEAVLKVLIIVQVFVLGSSGWEMGYSKLTEFYLDNNGTTEGVLRLTEAAKTNLTILGNLLVACLVAFFLFEMMVRFSYERDTKISKYLKNIWNFVINLIRRIGALGILIELSLSTSFSESFTNGAELIFNTIILYVLFVRINQLNVNALLKTVFKHVENQHEWIDYSEERWDYKPEQNYFLIQEEWVPYFKDQTIATHVVEELGTNKRIESFVECKSKFKWLFGGLNFSLTATQLWDEIKEVKE